MSSKFMKWLGKGKERRDDSANSEFERGPGSADRRQSTRSLPDKKAKRRSLGAGSDQATQCGQQSSDPSGGVYVGSGDMQPAATKNGTFHPTAALDQALLNPYHHPKSVNNVKTNFGPRSVDNANINPRFQQSAKLFDKSRFDSVYGSSTARNDQWCDAASEFHTSSSDRRRRGAAKQQHSNRLPSITDFELDSSRLANWDSGATENGARPKKSGAKSCVGAPGREEMYDERDAQSDIMFDHCSAAAPQPTSRQLRDAERYYRRLRKQQRAEEYAQRQRHYQASANPIVEDEELGQLQHRCDQVEQAEHRAAGKHSQHSPHESATTGSSRSDYGSWTRPSCGNPALPSSSCEPSPRRTTAGTQRSGSMGPPKGVPASSAKVYRHNRRDPDDFSIQNLETSPGARKQQCARARSPSPSSSNSCQLVQLNQQQHQLRHGTQPHQHKADSNSNSGTPMSGRRSNGGGSSRGGYTSREMDESGIENARLELSRERSRRQKAENDLNETQEAVRELVKSLARFAGSRDPSLLDPSPSSAAELVSGAVSAVHDLVTKLRRDNNRMSARFQKERELFEEAKKRVVKQSLEMKNLQKEHDRQQSRVRELEFQNMVLTEENQVLLNNQHNRSDNLTPSQGGLTQEHSPAVTTGTSASTCDAYIHHEGGACAEGAGEATCYNDQEPSRRAANHHDNSSSGGQRETTLTPPTGRAKQPAERVNAQHIAAMMQLQSHNSRQRLFAASSPQHYQNQYAALLRTARTTLDSRWPSTHNTPNNSMAAADATNHNVLAADDSTLAPREAPCSRQTSMADFNGTGHHQQQHPFKLLQSFAALKGGTFNGHLGNQGPVWPTGGAAMRPNVVPSPPSHGSSGRQNHSFKPHTGGMVDDVMFDDDEKPKCFAAGADSNNSASQSQGSSLSPLETVSAHALRFNKAPPPNPPKRATGGSNNLGHPVAPSDLDQEIRMVAHNAMEAGNRMDLSNFSEALSVELLRGAGLSGSSLISAALGSGFGGAPQSVLEGPPTQTSTPKGSPAFSAKVPPTFRTTDALCKPHCASPGSQAHVASPPMSQDDGYSTLTSRSHALPIPGQIHRANSMQLDGSGSGREASPTAPLGCGVAAVANQKRWLSAPELGAALLRFVLDSDLWLTSESDLDSIGQMAMTKGSQETDLNFCLRRTRSEGSLYPLHPLADLNLQQCNALVDRSLSATDLTEFDKKGDGGRGDMCVKPCDALAMSGVPNSTTASTRLPASTDGDVESTATPRSRANATVFADQSDAQSATSSSDASSHSGSADLWTGTRGFCHKQRQSSGVRAALRMIRARGRGFTTDEDSDDNGTTTVMLWHKQLKCRRAAPKPCPTDVSNQHQHGTKSNPQMLVRYSPPRASILRRDVYVRYAKEERKALAQFDFLDGMTTTDVSACEGAGKSPGSLGRGKGNKQTAATTRQRPLSRCFSDTSLSQSVALATSCSSQPEAVILPVGGDPNATYVNLPYQNDGAAADHVATKSGRCSADSAPYWEIADTTPSSNSSLSFHE